MSTHSVEHHLRVTVAEYDAQIRRFVPHYDEMLRVGVELLASLVPADATVLDLGAGTGALAGAVLAGLPGARVELLDVDPQMLAQARSRLAGQARASFREASYFDPLPACDAVVASLSLHHVHDLAEKTALYAAIRGALRPGGVLLNLDAAVSDDPRLAARSFAGWISAMGERGISDDEARGHLAAWAREDRYLPLHVELGALARAGFAAPECFWRRDPVAIYGGRVA